MKSSVPSNYTFHSEREETFWNCCLELIPVVYVCIMTLGVCFLCRYGLYIQGAPALGAEIHTPGRISKYYIVVAALYYVFLGLALLFPVHRTWANINEFDDERNIDDWRFSGKKAIFLSISIVGAILIYRTRFYILWDEQIANYCRATLLIGGALLAGLCHIIIRVAIWRKAETEHYLSYPASTVCEIITKICYALTIVGAIMFFLVIPSGIVI